MCVSVYGGCVCINRNVSVWPVLGICLAMVDGLVCAPVNVNTVLFIWSVLACVVHVHVCLAGTV